MQVIKERGGGWDSWVQIPRRGWVAFKLLKMLIGEISLSADIHGGLKSVPSPVLYIQDTKQGRGSIRRGTKRGLGPGVALNVSALKIFVELRQSINMWDAITMHNLTPQTTQTLFWVLILPCLQQSSRHIWVCCPAYQPPDHPAVAAKHWEQNTSGTGVLLVSFLFSQWTTDTKKYQW